MDTDSVRACSKVCVSVCECADCCRTQQSLVCFSVRVYWCVFSLFCSRTALRPVDLSDVLVCKYFKGPCFRRTFVIECKSKQIIYAGQEIQGAVSAIHSIAFSCLTLITLYLINMKNGDY